MTEEQFRLIKRLNQCRMLPGSWDKRFIRSLGALPIKAELTFCQEAQLNRMHYRYRVQLGEPNMPHPGGATQDTWLI